MAVSVSDMEKMSMATSVDLYYLIIKFISNVFTGMMAGPFFFVLLLFNANYCVLFCFIFFHLGCMQICVLAVLINDLEFFFINHLSFI